MKKSISKIFDSEIYLLSLTTWLLINSIRFVSLSRMSQLVSIGFGVWGLVIILNNVFLKNGTIFAVPGVGLAIVFILTVAISFVGNGMSAPVKNIYTIIAVCINFLIIYTSPFLTERGYIKRMLRTIVILTLLLNAINLVLLYFRYSYVIGDLDNIREATFIGVDTLRGRFTGLSGNANGLSRLALNGLLASVTLLIFDKYRKFKVVVYASFVVNVLVVLLAQSRASIYALSFAIGVSIPLYLFLRFKDGNKHRVISAAILMTMVIVIALASLKIIDRMSYIAVNNYPKAAILGDNGNSNNNGEVSELPDFDLSGRDDEATNEDFSNGRLTLIVNGIRATLEYNPLFGLSYAGATEKIQKYITENKITMPLYLYNSSGQMHNTFVQSFVYYGFLGFTALSIFFIYVFICFLKFLFSRKELSTIQATRFSVIMFIASVMVAMNMVEWVFVFDFDNHLINLVFFTVLGSLIKEISAHSKDLVACKFDLKVRDLFRKFF